MKLNVWSVEQISAKKSESFASFTEHTVEKSLVFLQEFENLLEFLQIIKNDTILCGESSIDTIKKSKHKFDYEELLLALDSEKQSFEPTRVTPTSATGFNHILTSY